MEVTLFGIVTLVRRLLANALSPMEVTLFGMVTLVRFFPRNASSPMATTGLTDKQYENQ